jgi:hypothetical protein
MRAWIDERFTGTVSELRSRDGSGDISHRSARDHATV